MIYDFKNDDRFDLCGALYFWLQHNWASQSDPKYSAFCHLTAPGMYKRARLQESQMEDGEEYIYSEITEDNWIDAFTCAVTSEVLEK